MFYLLYRRISYKSLKLKMSKRRICLMICLDVKLAMFSTFSVGLVTIDLGSDSFQGNAYIEEGNYYWGYTTISTMFVPLLSACVYVILNRGKRFGTILEVLSTIGRHIPFIQPFVHLYYLIRLSQERAQINLSLEFYQNFW